MAVQLKGRCVCNALQYSLHLSALDEARTTLCHCQSCRRAFGSNYGLTTKVRLRRQRGISILTVRAQVPVESFKYEAGHAKLYKQDNGVTREFCEICGAYICEYGVSLRDGIPISRSREACTGSSCGEVSLRDVGIAR